MKRLCMKLDIYKTVEYRDNAIFKTKKVGEIWIQLGEALPYNAGEYTFVSTNAPNEYKEIS